MVMANTFHALVIIAAFPVYTVMIIFNAISGFEIDGLFNGGGQKNVSDKYYTDITPAGLTFAIWGVIFAWQALLLLYSLASLCRKGADGPLYRSPVLLPPVFFIVYMVNNVFTTTWLFLWDREMMVAAFVILALVASSLYICIGISFRYLGKNMAFLDKYGMEKEKYWIWFGVQNGLAVYATWTSLATMINMAVVMEYVAGVSRVTSGTVALSIILVGFLTWSVVELAFLDKYARYLFMPYVTVCWAVGGVVNAHWGVDWTPTYQNAVFTAVVLAISVALGVFKIAIMIFRHFRHPLTSSDDTVKMQSAIY